MEMVYTGEYEMIKGT